MGDTVGKKIAELKLKLSVSDDDVRQIELETKGQINNKRWFEVRTCTKILVHSILQCISAK